jgi:hypothetical protein
MALENGPHVVELSFRLYDWNLVPYAAVLMVTEPYRPKLLSALRAVRLGKVK